MEGYSLFEFGNKAQLFFDTDDLPTTKEAREIIELNLSNCALHGETIVLINRISFKKFATVLCDFKDVPELIEKVLEAENTKLLEFLYVKDGSEIKIITTPPRLTQPLLTQKFSEGFYTADELLKLL
jgi:hypothetical protein